MNFDLELPCVVNPKDKLWLLLDMDSDLTISFSPGNEEGEIVLSKADALRLADFIRQSYPRWSVFRFLKKIFRL